MKTKKIAAIICLLYATQVCYAQDSELKISIEGIKSNKGRILVMVYESEDGFPTDPSKGQKIEPSSAASTQAVEVTINNLREGLDYALAVLHDENDNGKLDTNFLGIPKEGVAVSNNALGNMGPPKFIDAKFKFVPGMKLQPLKISY